MRTIPALHINTSRRCGSRVRKAFASSSTDCRELISAFMKIRWANPSLDLTCSMRELAAASFRPVK